MSDIKFIPPDVRDQLLAKADLLDIIRHFHPELVKAGSAFKGKCPSCASDRFTVTTAKGIIKCFQCDEGAGDVIGYLTKFRGMKYVDACIWLAGHLNFDIPSVDHLPAASLPAAAAVSRQVDDSSFRDEQLKSSGITEEAQQCINIVDDKEVISDRYTAGSVDSKFMPIVGHDMLIHYYDLDGRTIMYAPKHGKIEKPYIRVRHKYPNAHPDQDHKPIRYMSPPGSKNHLWIPEHIRRMFQARDHIETLVFVEGEKKADALCMVGINAVGIAGIYNFARDNEMPALIERLITTCSVTNVMFWFDSDLEDLGSDIAKDTDQRPRTFAKAALKFRAYFYKFQQEDINIQTWICHGLDTQHKGADDLLIALSPELTHTHPLAVDFTDTLRHPTSEGQHLRMHQITAMSDTRIYELWHLHAPSAFMRRHQEQLKALPEFRINKHRYRWDAAENRFESVQKILSHEQYWFTHDTKFGSHLKFDHLNITHFLHARGYWRQRTGLGKFRLIQVQNAIVTETCPEDIQSYVYEFTRQIEETKVLRMLMEGGTRFFGPDKLKNLNVFEPPFVKPSRDEEIMIFRDCYWKITTKGITVHKHTELPGAVWSDDVIDFSPTKIDTFFTVVEDKTSNVPYLVESDIEDCDMLRYIQLTSDIHWRDARQTETTWPDKSEAMEEKDITRLNTMMTCMIDKIIATGYCASKFLDPASMKAIVCMDARESKGGASEGGTGKSVWAKQFELILSIHKINGKQSRLTDDDFLYDGVDERTDLILVDDCRRTTDFEAFFSFITGGVIANSKGVSKKAAGLKRWVFTTNFSIRGEDRSHLRRQYNIAFSDYFNAERDPVSIFGHSLFEEWDDKQLNYYYNWIAHCIQFYMQHGLKTFAPDADIKRRKLRDMIGEIWLDYLETYFYTGSDYINRRFEIEKLLESFARKNPSQKQFAIKTEFKKKADMFCRYAGFNYNRPEVANKDGRIRNPSRGIEYFCISDHEFDLMKYSNDVSTSLLDQNHLPDF